MIFKKYKKYIFSLLLITILSFLGVFVFTSNAQAELTSALVSFSAKTIANVVALLLGFFKWILGGLLYIAAHLSDWALNITNFTDVPLVQIGWTITRGIANMFFVLILITIALATILQIETYGMKSLLPKLIIAALLINFSLVLAGVIIDASQILTSFFIEAAASGQGVSTNIMNGLDIHRIYQHDAEALEKLKQAFSTPATTVIAESFFSIIILLVATFTFGALAFFLLVRIVFLWFLLIVSPIAWLLMIIPQGRGVWGDWWRSFIKWSFFAPIYSFFLYLTLLTIQTGSIGTSIAPEATFEAGPVLSSKFASTPNSILQYIIITMMLLGGLIVAQKASAYGAGGAIKIAKGVGSKTGQFGRWGGKATAGAIGQMPGLKDRTAKMKNWAMTGGSGKWQGLEKVPIVGRTLGGPGKYSAAQAEKVKKEREKLSNRTADDLKVIANQRTFTADDRVRKAAALSELAKQGGFDYKDAEAQERIDFLKSMHADVGEVTKYRPDLAPLAGLKKKDETTGQMVDLDKAGAISKVVSGIKPKDLENLQAQHITKDVEEAIKKELTKSDGKWKKNHLEKMAEENAALFNKIYKNVIKDNRGKFRSDINKFLDSDAGKFIMGDEITSSKSGSDKKDGDKEESTIISGTDENFRKAKQQSQQS